MEKVLCIFSLAVLLTLTAASSLKAEGDSEAIYNDRVQAIRASYYNPELSSQWLRELTAMGNWTDVDYTTGCPARRANWPAQDHFHRILTMASSWRQAQDDVELLGAISTALDYWFDRDFHHDDCINAGGNDRLNCPCGTPGFWNTNWYDQMILIPNLVGSTCLLLQEVLTPPQFTKCTVQTLRAYERIDGDPNGSMGAMTGANLLDVASIGVSLSILTGDQFLLEDAVSRIFSECTITEQASLDGIKVDGSYMQHSSQIYTGNYGKVFMNNMIRFFRETKNTSLVAGVDVQDAFLTLIEGSEWFIYRKEGNGTFNPELSWQYSVIGRMISHKHPDWRGIDLNLQSILDVTEFWNRNDAFKTIVNRINGSQTDVNPGDLLGTRFFYIADYMVHRGPDYIITLKMFSSRSTNSECNNGQNPYGFHLSDGAIYTYISGDEYTNVYGAWDWNLIPGTTVAYDSTPLSCSSVQFKGKESFVGGVYYEHVGVAVMNYTNPHPSAPSTQWLKTFFFFPSMYIVQFVGNVNPGTTSAPVYTILDQSQISSTREIYLDGILMQGELVENRTTRTIWHNRIGYEFLQPVSLTVDIRPRVANWSEIGISEGNETQTHFTAFFQNDLNVDDSQNTYITHVNIDHNEFAMKTKRTSTIVLSPSNFETAVVRGATYDDPISKDRVIALAFMTAGDYVTGLEDITNVSCDSPVLLVFQQKTDAVGWNLAVSDPAQRLLNVKIDITLTDEVKSLIVQLPLGPRSGDTVVVNF